MINTSIYGLNWKQIELKEMNRSSHTVKKADIGLIKIRTIIPNCATFARYDFCSENRTRSPRHFKFTGLRNIILL
jgi:hypothetical protein